MVMILHMKEVVKPNCLMSFPNAVKRIIDALPEWQIKYKILELSGGYTLNL